MQSHNTRQDDCHNCPLPGDLGKIVGQFEIGRRACGQYQSTVARLIVIEFIANTEGTEYSNKPTYPPGK